MPLTQPMKAGRAFLSFVQDWQEDGCLGFKAVRECALITTGTREKFLEGSIKGMRHSLKQQFFLSKEKLPINKQSSLFHKALTCVRNQGATVVSRPFCIFLNTSSPHRASCTFNFTIGPFSNAIYIYPQSSFMIRLLNHLQAVDRLYLPSILLDRRTGQSTLELY